MTDFTIVCRCTGTNVPIRGLELMDDGQLSPVGAHLVRDDLDAGPTVIPGGELWIDLLELGIAREFGLNVRPRFRFICSKCGNDLPARAENLNDVVTTLTKAGITSIDLDTLRDLLGPEHPHGGIY